MLLSAAVKNDWLLNEKQKTAIKPQTFIERSKSDYKNKESDNGTKVTGIIYNYEQMDLKILRQFFDE